VNTKRRGFSLLEMVVVLAILAALATVALRAVTGTQSEGRYQQSTRSLSDIRDAIVGPSNLRGPDGGPIVSGFVADIGRLPNVLVSPSDPLPLLSTPQAGDPFNELLQQNSIPPFAFVSGNIDSSVQVGVGWQGPYVRLGVGPTYIRDGWGHSLQYTPGGVGAVTTITSTGSGGSDTYGQPVTVTLPGNGIGAPYATLSGQVSMNIATDASPSPNAGNQSGPAPNITYSGPPGSTTPVAQAVNIWVCYFGPDLTATGHPVAEIAQQVTGPNWQFTFTGSKITIGPRVLKVYVIPSVYTSFNSAAVSAAYVVSSLNVTATGGNQTVNLVLPHYQP
jgi:prepilin-type N-terminal cleavage/methylation domain-containing protein